MNLLAQEQNQFNLQNFRNKTTVKKQNPIKFFRKFTQTHDKQNLQFNSNLIYNQTNTIGKKSVSFQDGYAGNCFNHPLKVSQFIVKIDGEQLSYCRKCATHIASQGFDVHKIIDSTNTINMKKNRTLSNTSKNLSNVSRTLANISPNRNRQYSQSLPLQQIQRSKYQKKHQLIQFTKKLKNLRQEYIHKQQYLSSVCQSFQAQKQIISDYYDELLKQISFMKQSHLQLLEQKSLNTIQLCQIQKGQIQETVGQINEMVQDIQTNIQSIINEIQQENYVECFAFYQQKQGIFSHRLEQLATDTKPSQNTSSQLIHGRIQEFKSFMKNLNQLGNQSQQNQAQSLYEY